MKNKVKVTGIVLGIGVLIGIVVKLILDNYHIEIKNED